MKWGIGTKVVVFVVVVTMLGVAITAGVLWVYGTDILTQKKMDSLDAEVDLEGLRLSSFIAALGYDLRFLAELLAVQGVVLAQRAGGVDPGSGLSEEAWTHYVESLFVSFLRSKPAYGHIEYFGLADHGRELVHVRLVDDHVTVAPKEDLQSGEGQDHFEGAIRLPPSQVYFLDIMPFTKERGLELQAAVPVYSAEGDVLGAIAISMDLSKALETLIVSPDEEDIRYLTNAVGQVLMHSDPALPSSFDVGEWPRLQEIVSGLSPLFEPGSLTHETMGRLKSQRGDVVVFFEKIPFDPLHPERFLGLAGMVYHRDLVAGVAPFRDRAVLLAMVMIVGPAVLFLLFFMRVLLRPLGQLTRAVERAAAGGYDGPLPVKSSDELGFLAHSFQSMMHQVREREEALRESESRLTNILALAPVCIISVDVSQRIFGFNRAAESIFGYSAEEAIGQPLDILLPARYVGVHRFHFQGFAASPEVARPMNFEGEVSCRRKNGTEFPGEISVSKIEVGLRKVYTAIVRDITERKLAEQALAQRTQELERSNQDLQQFAYVASHDLQEPLRMVASYTQLLARRYQGKLDADADDFIAYTVDGANRMQAMISNLLEFSRVTTRGRELESTDSSAAFEQAVANLRAAIEESGAVVTHDALPTVMADALQLAQVFQNLIDNAVKFHGEESPQVHVSAERKGDEWLFSVRDNGIGIDPQYFDRLFVIFQRLHSRSEYPGTGIGLALCKRIVERHGGRIWVESEPGKGATFFFTLLATGGDQP
ncbi:MAG: PAS domain S-box protein [Chloroflexi bacterium]|nr:PAS domain S-box protein [Chloroflexota bacterium]